MLIACMLLNLNRSVWHHRNLSALARLSILMVNNICDRLWENQTFWTEFSIELQLNLCLQCNKMLLVYKYLQSFYYLSVKSDALNPTLSIEAPRPNFRYYLIFPNWAIFERRFLDTTFYGFEFLMRITQVWNYGA